MVRFRFRASLASHPWLDTLKILKICLLNGIQKKSYSGGQFTRAGCGGLSVMSPKLVSSPC